MRNVLALILGGGQGSRLHPLTELRSKPAVPIGGKYRLIDVPISNCLHADLRRIFVLTQFNSASLNRHIGKTYHLDMFSDGFVEVLAALTFLAIPVLMVIVVVVAVLIFLVVQLLDA